MVPGFARPRTRGLPVFFPPHRRSPPARYNHSFARYAVFSERITRFGSNARMDRRHRAIADLTALPLTSGYLLQLHQTYRCTAMRRFEPALAVHSGAAIGPTRGKCFPDCGADAPTHPFSGLS